ncbi:MAG: hypothetical protein RR817_07735 [Niameybacter sp.]
MPVHVSRPVAGVAICKMVRLSKSGPLSAEVQKVKYNTSKKYACGCCPRQVQFATTEGV